MGVIVVGGLVALVMGLKDFRNMNKFFGDVRRDFGRPLILGLEILVAADIIKTITVDPSFEGVAVLGILVAVRIALSFSRRCSEWRSPTGLRATPAMRSSSQHR